MKSSRPMPQYTHMPHVLRRSMRQRNKESRIAQLAKITGTTSFLFSNHQRIYESPDAIEPRIDCHNHAKTIYRLDPWGQDHLKYLINLDLLQEDLDDDTETWNPIYIYSHRVRKHHGRRRFEVKAGWRYHGPSWVDGHALQIQNPYTLIDYATRNNLLNHRDFAWIHLLEDDDVEKFSKSFAATRQEGPKFKFGQLIPKNVAHAMAIDKTNGDTGWQDAINTELNQIN